MPLIAGRRGRALFGLAAKLNALVKSPVARRRHGDRFGTLTPNRVSMNRSVDVWSKMSEHNSPPRENGETTIIGTLNPSPIGPRIPSASAGSFETVRYSPFVPLGGVGGVT